MSGFRHRRPRRAESSCFFVDSIDDPALQEPADAVRRFSECLIFAIALATAVGAAGLLGLFQLLRLTES